MHESLTLRIAARIPETIVDGPGLRYAVYTQGCPFHCEGCHNQQTHDPAGGQIVTVDTLLSEIDRNPLLDGLTITGGEPFMQVLPLAGLADQVRRRGLDIWLYSGYIFEELIGDHEKRTLLARVNVLVDGPYIAARRSLNLLWRGSDNQRVIDVQASLRVGTCILYRELK